MGSSQEDDYWDSSSATRKAHKNPFSDDVDYASAKKILTLDYDDDEDNCDSINWDGSAVTRVEYKSARFRSGSVDNRASPTASRTPQQTSIKPAEFSIAGPRPTFQPQAVSQALSIEDAISKPKTSHTPTLSEVSKLEAENQCLKRNLEAAKKFSKVPVKDLLRSIILGQPYTLELYRSKEDKLALLDEAIKSHDGNAITIAVLHLRAKLKSELFNLELSKRPAAIAHYLCYLRECNELLYHNTLGMLGRTRDEAVYRYRQACLVGNPRARLTHLQACQRSHFLPDSKLAVDTQLVTQHIQLLSMQIDVEAEDVKASQEGAAKFRDKPRKASLIEQPLITSLFYCWLYHADLPESCPNSAAALKINYKLSERQYAWTSLRVGAMLQRWDAIRAIFHTKGLFGGTKTKAVLPFDRVVGQLYKEHAPRRELNYYCKLIDDTERRIDVGEKCECHETVLETHMQRKDRQSIAEYQSKLQIKSQEWFYANKILQDPSIKWRN